ncbi:TetR/AcrR family transcriptional regulator C-terminal domain-containing protein [Desulfovibrio sp. UCD-KL4C]|uniref:TetR/AcrR family transcriptional regulator C-terminal domain-containing protein n=1 Tax=Desulfovibrio sp. UCD-KL4C TaxID=2578120 RepID=UPI0025C4182C|nr:TetR/AcrR family transcriptional regulator C-terminal domain-containing protein [Desulfovibrio sp. UCD-KL4C]
MSLPLEGLTHFAIGFLEVHMSKTHLAGIRLLISEGPEAPEMTRAFFAVGSTRTKSALLDFFKTRLSADDPEYAIKMFISTLLSMRMEILVGLRINPTHEEINEHAKRTADICIEHFSK